MTTMTAGDKVFVAGGRGLVGSAIRRHLAARGFKNILAPSHEELDLAVASEVDSYFERNRPDYVFLAAAKVGGIKANSTYPADFIRENLLIELNIIHAAYRFFVKKLLFLGSSCIYPKLAPHPISEEALLTGKLEETNIAYATAKIAGIVMCQAYNRQFGTRFISAMPTNLYGVGDSYHPENSHVIPGMLHKFHQAKVARAPSVTLWGTGRPLREFLLSDDLAEACVFLMENLEDDRPVNIGSGEEVSIAQLAELIANVTDYRGRIDYDASYPDGTPRKILDSRRIREMGWKPSIPLATGLKIAYEDFLGRSGV